MVVTMHSLNRVFWWGEVMDNASARVVLWDPVGVRQQVLPRPRKPAQNDVFFEILFTPVTALLVISMLLCIIQWQNMEAL